MIRAYLELLRPANVATALADVLAGFAVAGLQPRSALPWLLLSTAALYAGGIVLNDVFDRQIDRIERPERPIPSGRIAVRPAALLGGALLAAGAVFAFAATAVAGAVALAIAAAVLLYDAWGKRHDAVAPFSMGLCRGLNLLLGVAAAPAALGGQWRLAAIPLLYIAAVTALSRGEVHGGRRQAGTRALIFLGAALAGLVIVAGRSGTRAVPAAVLISALAWRVWPAFWHARRLASPAAIRHAVKRGVLSLVLLDAVIGASYAGPLYAALILFTGLVAGWLARLFAVT